MQSTFSLLSGISEIKSGHYGLSIFFFKEIKIDLLVYIHIDFHLKRMHFTIISSSSEKRRHSLYLICHKELKIFRHKGRMDNNRCAKKLIKTNPDISITRHGGRPRKQFFDKITKNLMSCLAWTK